MVNEALNTVQAAAISEVPWATPSKPRIPHLLMNGDRCATLKEKNPLLFPQHRPHNPPSPPHEGPDASGRIRVGGERFPRGRLPESASRAIIAKGGVHRLAAREQADGLTAIDARPVTRPSGTRTGLSR